MIHNLEDDGNIKRSIKKRPSLLSDLWKISSAPTSYWKYLTCLFYNASFIIAVFMNRSPFLLSSQGFLVLTNQGLKLLHNRCFFFFFFLITQRMFFLCLKTLTADNVSFLCNNKNVTALLSSCLNQFWKCSTNILKMFKMQSMVKRSSKTLCKLN